MVDNFNPKKTDLLLIEGLILDIKAKKNVLINRKISFQNSLSTLKDKYKLVSPNSKEFKRIKSVRQNIIEHCNGIELKIKMLNQELNYKNKLKVEIEHHISGKKSLENADILNKLNILKSKYIEFSKDRTRISSLRVCAAEFVSELDNIIKNI